MSWQAAGPGPGGGTGTDDPFSTVETEVRAMASAPWWNAAPPQQRAEAITSRMLAGAGEWWLFGAWARWYRCGLDGGWQPCPPPADPGSRRRVFQAPRGAGNPPVPPQLLPTGPDLAAGRVASGGFLGAPPEPAAVARLQQAQINALGVNVAQFALQDPTFQPHTPSTLAAAWGALLWCAGAPVALDTHPMIALFAPYLTTPADRLRWMTPPDFSTLAGYYIARLGAGDWTGAAMLVRVMHEVASGLRDDPRFRPGADALAAITAATLPLVQHDMATVRYGPAAVLQEWRRRCPAEFALPMVRDAAPGEFLRLGLYDLQQTVARLHGGPLDHNEVRRSAVALLAADLQAAPAAAPAVLPWLDPDGARTVRAVLGDPRHPGRRLWPRDGRLPDELRGDPGALEELLVTSYTLGLTWCRLAQSPPPPSGFAVAAAAGAALTEAAAAQPPSTGELTPWQIIEAARAHMASERAAAPRPAPAPEAGPPADHPAPQARTDPPPARPDTPGGSRDGDHGFPPPAPPHGPAAPDSGPDLGPGSGPGGDPWPRPTSPAPFAPDPGANPWAEPASPAAFAQDAPAVPPSAPTRAGPPPAPPAPAPVDDDPYPPTVRQPAPSAPAPAVPPSPPPWPSSAETAFHPPGPAPETTAYPPQPTAPPPLPDPLPDPARREPPGGVPVAEAYGIRFLGGLDDIDRLVTEVRRRGKWAQRLRGQEVSSASMPALLLIGEASTGQRRLGRMVARALADVDVSSGQLRSVHVDEVRHRGPDGLRAVLAEHAGHALLLEDLDGLLLDDPHGAAFATVLYRARAEGVSDTALLATCEPSRFAALSAAAPEVITDMRAVRMPDLTDTATRTALLALLAEERRLRLDVDAWDVVGRDIGTLRGRGRLTNARLIEAYLDRACTRNLGRAAETQAIGSAAALTLTGADFQGLTAELSPH
ncbi:hypothetical protein [Thermomonospora umbrina]|uniref:ATPase family protein associated with various cellular activities (AAA) n=1 Tax=Thermomonospora umbrina TaxID=111806 RepID=A0A3D9T9G5_9ACTN|nr:hypothetical protein [Thermomonospora umbrina]REF00402.1 hypothetical protein DFJ69_5937 [Thermomonospora umbrina]